MLILVSPGSVTVHDGVSLLLKRWTEHRGKECMAFSVTEANCPLSKERFRCIEYSI